MMRPDVSDLISRWGEVIAGTAIGSLGAWWAIGSYGLLRWVGMFLALGGAILLYQGALRLRRPGDGGGAGVVVVDERQITYLSGYGGGAVSLDRLERVAILQNKGAAALWHLSDRDGQQITVPVDAEGAISIFDALTALPGLSEGQVVGAMRGGATGTKVVWERAPARLG